MTKKLHQIAFIFRQNRWSWRSLYRTQYFDVATALRTRYDRFDWFCHCSWHKASMKLTWCSYFSISITVNQKIEHDDEIRHEITKNDSTKNSLNHVNNSQQWRVTFFLNDVRKSQLFDENLWYHIHQRWCLYRDSHIDSLLFNAAMFFELSSKFVRKRH